ncbi:uncharacterized protein LOC144158850 [Haemaphysalis longicornis]
MRKPGGNSESDPGIRPPRHAVVGSSFHFGNPHGLPAPPARRAGGEWAAQARSSPGQAQVRDARPYWSHGPRRARGGGCSGNRRPFSRPYELFYAAPASSGRGSAFRSTRATGTMAWLLRLSRSSALLCPPKSGEPAGSFDDGRPGPHDCRGADEVEEGEEDKELCPDDLLPPTTVWSTAVWAPWSKQYGGCSAAVLLYCSNRV